MEINFKIYLFASVALGCLQINALAMDKDKDDDKLQRTLMQSTSKDTSWGESNDVNAKSIQTENWKDKLEQLRKGIDEIDRIYTSSREHGIAIVGLTGSGKSTLFNYLLAVPLCAEKDPNDIEIMVGAKGGFKSEIADGFNSGTTIPVIGKGQDVEEGQEIPVFYYDSAGFRSTATSEGTSPLVQDIVNSYSLYKVLKNTVKLKILLVASENQIREKNDFIPVIQKLAGMFPSIDITKNLCMIITQRDKIQSLDKFQSVLAAKCKGVALDTDQKNITDFLSNPVNKQRIAFFDRPKIEGDISLDNKDDILKAIKNTEFLEKLSPQFSVMEGSEELIKSLAARIVQNLSSTLVSFNKEFTKLCEKFTEDTDHKKQEKTAYKKVSNVLEKIFKGAENFDSKVQIFRKILNEYFPVLQEEFSNILEDFNFLDRIKPETLHIDKNPNWSILKDTYEYIKSKKNPSIVHSTHIPGLHTEKISKTSSQKNEVINEPTKIKLIKKRLINEYTKKEKNCFQFMNEENKVFRDEGDPYFYDISTLKTRLKLTEKIYNGAIENIKKNAHSALKIILNADHVDENLINHLLTNYLDELNTDETINVTGSSVTRDELVDMQYYMKLCNAVYTDFSTRSFLARQNLPNIEKKWNEIIYIKETIYNLIDIVSKTNDRYNSLSNIKSTFESKSGKNVQSTQALSLERENDLQNIIKDYNLYIKKINNFLTNIQKDIIDDSRIDHIDNVIKKLNSIYQEINCEFSFYFKEKKENIEDLGLLKGLAIPTFQTLKKAYQLTAKAVIASSFLSKAGLLANENITIIDVGFRNEERFGSAWNDFVTNIMQVKDNPKAWFHEHGEVDYIAYIEKDLNFKKDKLVITYSGSNGQIDWGIDLTIGQRPFLGISVHDGIGWLFRTSTDTYHSVLMERIRNYYENTQKPAQLEIITTGHSLGAGLAELAAYYYKTTTREEFKNILGHDKILVKTFTFAGPAIVDSPSKEVIETALGKNNIYRVWVSGDKVVEWTEIKNIGGQHIGKSLPLYNIQNLSTNLFDWWGPHGADRYLCYLHALGQENYSSQYKKFTKMINNYFKTTNLNIYKKNLRELKSIMYTFMENNLPDNLDLSLSLAQHIVKYSPMTVSLVPYSTVREINPNSPRYAAAISPQLLEKAEWHRVDKIDAVFKIESRKIKFQITNETECTIDSVKNFLQKDFSIILDDSSVEDLSCGCFVAKHLFVSQDKKLNTLNKIFSQSVIEKASTPQYLQIMSEGRNELEKTRKILEKVGLDEKFNDKSIIQRGSQQTEKSENMLNEITLIQLIQDTDGTYMYQEDNLEIYKKIIISLDPEKYSWNLLNCILNESILKNLLGKYTYKEAQFDNFSSNIKKKLLIIENINSNSMRILEKHLEELKYDVLEHTSWKIKENRKNNM